jgi:hypothetical protein
MCSPASPFNGLWHYFTPEEVQALYRLIQNIGFLPHDDDEMRQVINHICKIVEHDDMASGYRQTT